MTTGNVEGAAHIKLSRANLNRFFCFGGYGSDSPTGPGLTKKALERGKLISGRMTDGGIETALIFHRRLDLPEFAAFDPAEGREGTEECGATSSLPRWRQHGAGFVLESPTWRASPAGRPRSATRRSELDEANRKAISLMVELRDRQ